MVIVDVPEALKACTLVETVVVPSEMAAVIVLCPATLPPPTNARPGLLEVMVKATPPVGAAGLSVSNKDVCKLLPMVRFEQTEGFFLSGGGGSIEGTGELFFCHD